MLQSASHSRESRFVVNFWWLLQLRWVAVIGQALTIAFVIYVLRIEVMVAPLAIILGVTAISNLGLTLWFSRSSEDSMSEQDPSKNILLGLIMLLDMLSLTTLLYSTGGPTNPFNFFFFVNLSLSAIVLSRTWSWILNFVSIVCFAFLIYDHRPLEVLDLGLALQSIRISGTVTLQQVGIMVAFMTCSSVIVYFMTRLTMELKKQEDRLFIAQVRRAESEKLEALGTLAAGAAHELATPLSTIAVVAKEVENQLSSDPQNEEFGEDIRLIRSELERCRNILSQMSFDAGHAAGESLSKISVEGFVAEVLNGLPTGQESVDLDVDSLIAGETLLIPINQAAQAIRGIVKNAIDASPDDLQISVRVEPAESDPESVEWSIRDFGTGMNAETLRRISEPFFTTKAPGKGMGLGVFLARTIIEKLGGDIGYASAIGKGTTVKIRLPRTAELQSDL